MAQGIKGKITNAKGEPLPYVTIYSLTAKVGCNSNINGLYELKLPQGKQSVNFQSIDYKTLLVQTEIGENWQEKNLVLEEQTYELKEVQINSSKENPANFIMRKAIGAAPYYKRQVLKYSAKVYVKGTGKVDGIPRLFKGILKDAGITLGKAYVTESINELSFSQPSTYREKVISLQSTMPFKDAGVQPMRMARGSWYATNNYEVVSPLSPQAFSVYNFFLEGSFYENGREINKIRVEPKRKGTDLFKGTVYILEGLWCLHSLNLSRTELGMESTIKTSFKELPNYPYVWMPVTYDIKAVGDYLGIKGEFRYLASVSDYKVLLNTNIDHRWAQKQVGAPQLAGAAELATGQKGAVGKKKNAEQKGAVGKEKNVEQNGAIGLGKSGKQNASLDKEKDAEQNVSAGQEKPMVKTKNQREIEALLAKQELRKTDMIKLAARMKRESEKEIQSMRSVNDSSEIVVDSLALKMDSVFWAQNRPVPLLLDEQKSINEMDTSLAVKKDSLPRAKNKLSVYELLVSGDSFPGKQRYFAFKGPVYGLALNTVEGLNVEAKYSVGSSKHKPWRFTQSLRMPLERLRFQTVAELSYGFNPLAFGKAKLRGGSVITDFNSNGIDRFADAFHLLFLNTNYSKFYQQDFIEVAFERELMNGLQLQLGALYTNRYSIDNIARYQSKEGSKHISANRPNNLSYVDQTQQSFQTNASFNYRFFQQYKFVRNKKIYLPNEWPSLSLNYRHGRTKNALLFNKLSFGLNQNIHLLHWLNLQYQYTYSYFMFASTQMHFADYNQYAGNQSFFYMGAPFARYQQLPYYAYSNATSSQSMFVQLSFKKLLIRQLPYINLFDFNEQLYFNLLSTQSNMPNYFETGYRINNVLNRISLGVNFHFLNGKYNGNLIAVSYRF
ncbi:MAG: DUF5686 family protein [bacterium]|nr:DUF5686 family protein [bacterium]